MAISDVDILHALSPAAATARSCLVSCAAMGDDNAIRLLLALDEAELKRNRNSAPKTDDTESDADREFFTQAVMALGSVQWVKHIAVNKLFDALKMNTFVDLACGYTQRGIEFSTKQRCRYFGIDLPVVIDTMLPALSKVMSAFYLENKIFYRTADVTDYNALRRLIHGREQLFITTEGLMMYLTDPEVLTVMENIRKLLREFGGVWVTPDTQCKRWNEIVSQRVFSGMGENSLDRLNEVTDLDNSNVYNNRFTRLQGKELYDFFDERGLVLKKTNVGKLIKGVKLPDENLRSMYDEADILIISSKERVEISILSNPRSEFEIYTNRVGERLIFKIVGRLDAITSPELLEEYVKFTSVGQPWALTIDMEDCSYISSAGLRVLHMIYRGLPDRLGFKIENLHPKLVEIFRVTGYDKMLLYNNDED